MENSREIRVSKMDYKLRDKYLWAIIDENGFTVIQTFSAIYPQSTENYLKKLWNISS